jgi:hypothetical protein
MATLKISDLSVGDWVRCRGRNGRIERLDVIGDDQRISVAVKSYLGTMYQFVDIEDIEPISITAEILEKNGFKRHPKYGRFYCSESQLEVAFENGEWIHIISSFEYPIHTISGVHHIQHLLRLYGCEKEINL